MPCVVFIGNCGKILVVKSEWVYGINDAKTFNYGSSAADIYKLFYSPHNLDKPNFTLECENNFDDNRVACYNCHVLEIVGKLFDSYH